MANTNSLLDLGYVIEPGNGDKDDLGNEIVAVVYKPIFMKRTKTGRIKAYRGIDSKVESTIDRMYNFEMQANGDFIGDRKIDEKEVTP